MASVRTLTDLSVVDPWKEVSGESTLWGDDSREMLPAVKLLFENQLHDELAAYLHARSLRPPAQPTRVS